MKNILMLCCSLLAYRGYAQQPVPVIHNDLLVTETSNMAWKTMWHQINGSWLEKVKDNKDGTLKSLVGVEEVQRRIVNSLSEVEKNITQGKLLIYSGTLVKETFENLGKAADLAVGKPYLLVFFDKSAPLFYERTTALTLYIKEFLTKDSEQNLMNTAQRDKLIRKVVSELQVLNALSYSMVSVFKNNNIQDAVDKVVPFQNFVNMDKQLMGNIMLQFKMLK